MPERWQKPLKWGPARTPDQIAYQRQRGFRLRVEELLTEARSARTPRNRRLIIAGRLLERHADLLTPAEIVELERLCHVLRNSSPDEPPQRARPASARDQDDRARD